MSAAIRGQAAPPSPTHPFGWVALSRIAGEGAERSEAGEGDPGGDLFAVDRNNAASGRSPSSPMLLALPLSGCGKKGPPSPPPGVPDTYPRSYPRE